MHGWSNAIVSPRDLLSLCILPSKAAHGSITAISCRHSSNTAATENVLKGQLQTSQNQESISELLVTVLNK